MCGKGSSEKWGSVDCGKGGSVGKDAVWDEWNCWWASRQQSESEAVWERQQYSKGGNMVKEGCVGRTVV